MTVASISSYQAVVDKLPGKRSIVFGCFRNMGMTLKDLADILPDMAPSSISARVTELADRGLIRDCGLMCNGQTVWVKTSPDEVEATAERRRLAKRVEADIVQSKTIGTGVEFTVFVPNELYAKVRRSKRVRFL